MKIEIINKPMLCWDDNETLAQEWHVLAKVTECNINYPYKVICNKNTYPDNPDWGPGARGEGFKNAKPLPQSNPRTIKDGLVEGDIICNNNGSRKVLGVCGEAIFLSRFNEFNQAGVHYYKLEELIGNNYTLEQEVNQQVEELTVAEISKLLGKKVKVVE